MKAGEEAIHILNEKIAVFEVREQAQIQGQRQHEPSAFGSRCLRQKHGLDEVEIQKTRSQKDKDEFRSTPSVKNNAAQQQQGVFVPAIGQLVQEEEDGQKPNQKYDRAEYHVLSLVKDENSLLGEIFTMGEEDSLDGRGGWRTISIKDAI